MTSPELSEQALNKAMLEAVEFVHAEEWDAAPTLFALVPSDLLSDQLDENENSPLTLVVQDNLPDNLEAGSDALADYVSRIAWPAQVVGVVLAQEIKFRDTSTSETDAALRPARLFSGVLRSEVELTLLQLRPTEDELAERGPFAEDEIELRGGPTVAPGVIAALRYGLEMDPAEFEMD